MEAAGIHAASWVVGKALSPLSGGVLEAWAASTKLGSNMRDLKLELMYAQDILDKAKGREFHNSALADELLNKLRQLAYGADDVLVELDYFRIQDELDGTYHAADTHAAGCVQDLALNARHTVRSSLNKLKFPMCLNAARRDDRDEDEQEDGGKKGCLSGLRFCGRCHEIGSSSRSPANQLGEVGGACMPMAVHNVGKHFSCFSLLPYVKHDAPTRVVEIPKTTGENETLQTPKLNFDRVKMSKRILNITEQLKVVCAKVSSSLNLEHANSIHITTQDIAKNRAETSPVIIERDLYGRDSHKKIIVDEIVNSECRGLRVLPIVGPGGIGKTAFTQHIYNQIKSQFDIPIWICVSLSFDANKLAKDIVKKIPKVDNENKNCSDDELIQQRVKGKRVLLVLDDVWKHNENEWKKLMAPLKEEAKGNIVIVTTRLPEVANTVKTTKFSLELQRLNSQDIMLFFEKCVFVDQQPWVDHLELFDVGSKIVEKLKGSPLAAITVGRLLRNKLTLRLWRSVLESKEWESQTHESDIMPALKLSYDYLPFHLQQCFSFCSLFPEDYEFSSEELVHLWTVLNILQSCDQKKRKIYDFRLCYLDDLVNHGFFKMNKREDDRPYYVIHDLLHELAVRVSSYECLSICSSNVTDVHIPPSVRHLSIIVDDTHVKDKMFFEDYDGNLSALGQRLKVENIHTLMLFGNYHGSFAKTLGGFLKDATSLRIISLSSMSYNVEDILHNFSKLVHLRYLRIKAVCYHKLCLPSALFRLYHLEVLDLEHVYEIVSSTRHMSNLVKLRHFLAPETMLHLHSDIYGVGKLKFFQELKKFRVGKESEGFEPSQVGLLTEIGGSLRLYNLENVQTKEEANDLKLIHKKHVRELVLEWDVKRSNTDPVKEEIVLESLLPHSGLQELSIRGHWGTNCPSWLCKNLTVRSLESLCLDGVSWKNLPLLGEMWMVNERGEEQQGCSISPPTFHNLKRLQLSNISRLKRWVGNDACPLLSRLKVLIVRDCPELLELPFPSLTCYEAHGEDEMPWFPRLHELIIENCPKLASVPPIPWRKGSPCSAEIVDVGSGIKRLVYPTKYESELGLEIVGEDGQGDAFLWNCLRFSNLTNIEYLDVTNFPPLLLAHFHVLTSLKIIRIDRCVRSGEELTLLLSFLPNLSALTIRNCDNITGLGVAEHVKTASGEHQQQQTGGEEEIIIAAAAHGLLLLPPHLQELSIFGCEKIILLSNPPHDGQAAGEGRGGGLQRLRSLRYFYVWNCPEFLSSYSSSSSSFSPFPTCLQHLTLILVKHMETLQAISNLTSLTELGLYACEGSRDEGLWPLLAHGRITKLTLYDLPDFFAGSDPSRPHDSEVFSRSSKLLDLTTRHNTGFLAAPICSLFSSTLARLALCFDDEVEHLTKEQEEALQLLTSLQVLRFSGGRKLQRLPAGLHNLINLQKLEICLCSAIRSLPNLPSSLLNLEIVSCAAFKSLPNSLPSFLEILKISNCKAIKSLHKDGLPSSMRELYVHDGNSEELKRACRKLIGTIPIVRA